MENKSDQLSSTIQIARTTRRDSKHLTWIWRIVQTWPKGRPLSVPFLFCGSARQGARSDFTRGETWWTMSTTAKKRKPFEPHRAVRSLTGGERERCKCLNWESSQKWCHRCMWRETENPIHNMIVGVVLGARLKWLGFWLSRGMTRYTHNMTSLTYLPNITTYIQGVFFHWYPPKKLKYGKPRLGESMLA